MDEEASPRRPRAAILVPDDELPGAGRGDEARAVSWPEEADRGLVRALEALGYAVRFVPLNLTNVRRVIGHLKVDVAVNLCDGTGADGDGTPGLEVIDALEARGIPYTGARRQAYWLGSSKARMKTCFLEAGVPTPLSQVFGEADEPLQEGLTFPLFVKPVDTSGSAGVDLDSVVVDEPGLRARLAAVIPVYGPALVEEYVDGRELSVGIFGDGEELELLPPLEVVFGPAFPSGRGVRTFATKADRTSPLYRGFSIQVPATLAEAEREAVLEAALAAYRAVGGSGYGRVDLRLGPQGPRVLEVNPNCSLEWLEGDEHESGLFPQMAMAAGLCQADVYRRLIEIAQARPRAAAPARRRRVARPRA